MVKLDGKWAGLTEVSRFLGFARRSPVMYTAPLGHQQYFYHGSENDGSSNSLLLAGEGTGSGAARCTLIGRRVPSEMATQHYALEILRWGIKHGEYWDTAWCIW